MDKERALERLYRRRKVLDELKKVKAPALLIKSAHRLYDKTVSLLKKYGIRAEDYLHSPEGLVQYLIYSVNCDTKQNNESRCGRCQHYFMKDTTPKYGCYIYSNYIERVICKDFSDTLMDIENRITKLLVDRCFTCEHINVDSIKNGSDRCHKNLNRIDPNCIEYKPKKVKKT